MARISTPLLSHFISRPPSIGHAGWVLMALFLSGCEVEISGTVTQPAGDAIVGATLTAPGCSAVSGDAGAFRVNCPRGAYTFVVEHPAHAPGKVTVDASNALAPPPITAVLVAFPSSAGFYLEPDFTPLAAAPLKRIVSPGSHDYCLPEGTTLPIVPAGSTLFEVRDVEWRLHGLDDKGCALRVQQGVASKFWAPVSTRLEPKQITELAAGRYRVDLGLPAGRYAILPWYDGFLLPEDVAADTWSALAFEVP